MPSYGTIVYGVYVWGGGTISGNLSFEIAGTQIGRAAVWTISSSCAAFEVAGFDNDALGFESFELGWGVVQLDYAASLFEAASFEAGMLVESFDRLWGTPENSAAPFAWGLSEAAVFGADSFENFEAGWLNDDYFTSYDDVAFGVASFDTVPTSFENFEYEWNNDDPIWEFADGTFTAATFDGTALFEDFEEVLDGVEVYDVLAAVTGERYWINVNGVEFEYIALGGDGTDDIAIALRTAVNNSNFQVLATVITTDSVLLNNLGTAPMFFAAGGPANSISRTTPTLQTTLWLLPLRGV